MTIDDETYAKFVARRELEMHKDALQKAIEKEIEKELKPKKKQGEMRFNLKDKMINGTWVYYDKKKTTTKGEL